MHCATYKYGSKYLQIKEKKQTKQYTCTCKGTKSCEFQIVYHAMYL